MAGKSRRGFASMDPSRQREIASKGGRAAHAKGTAHEWSSDEARVAGQKGGVAVSRDRAHMAAIGREGGESRSRASRAARDTQQDVGMGSAGGDREMARPVSRELGGASGGLGGGSLGSSSMQSGLQPRPDDVQQSDRL
jgi:general stress protein YciG